jgi:hypothetical protein
MAIHMVEELFTDRGRNVFSSEQLNSMHVIGDEVHCEDDFNLLVN